MSPITWYVWPKPEKCFYVEPIILGPWTQIPDRPVVGEAASLKDPFQHGIVP